MSAAESYVPDRAAMVRAAALRLAGDEAFLADHAAFADRLSRGEVDDDGLTAEEFAVAYGLR